MNLIPKKTHISIVVVSAILIAIWPLPNTIAIRQIVLVIGLGLSLPVIRQYERIFLEKYAWPLWIFALSFIWVFIHLLFFSTNIDEQWHEFKGDWLRSLIAAVVGLGLGLVLSNPKQRNSKSNTKTIELIFFAGLSGTVTIFFFRYVYEIFSTAQWIHTNFFMTPFKSKTPIVIFGGIFLPFAFIKILEVLSGNEKSYWLPLAFLAVLLTLFANYFANTKNGFLILIFASSIFILNLIEKTRIRQQANSLFWPLIILLSLIILIGIKKHIDSNPGWKMLWSDIKISLDIDHHENWKNRVLYPLPINDHGVVVDGSTYERVAWAKAGVELIKENPLGYGLIHHSFGALAIKKWTNFYKPDGKTRGATHSGWLDFTLGLGLPGLLLVATPLCTSFWRSFHRKSLWNSYIAWTVPIIVFAYSITEVSSDHFIELLFFMTALFVGMTLTPNYKPSSCFKKDSAR